MPSPQQWPHQDTSAEQALLTGLWVQGRKKKKPLSDSSFRFRVNWSGWGLGVPSGENSFSDASQMGLSWRSGQRVGPLISTALNPLCSCIQCLSFAGTTVDTQGPPDAR